MKNMKAREFTLIADALEIDYEDFTSLGFVEEFIEEDLEIHPHYIESLELEDRYLNIKLSNTREYFNDDWYINLQRVS